MLTSKLIRSFSRISKPKNLFSATKYLKGGQTRLKNVSVQRRGYFHVDNRNRGEEKGWIDGQLIATQVAISDRIMMVKVDMKGFSKENVTVKVDGQWLIIEAFSSIVDSAENPSFTQRHVMRRFEIPPDADLTNIKSSFDAEKQLLIITIPRIKPEIKIM